MNIVEIEKYIYIVYVRRCVFAYTYITTRNWVQLDCLQAIRKSCIGFELKTLYSISSINKMII